MKMHVEGRFEPEVLNARWVAWLEVWREFADWFAPSSNQKHGEK